MTFPQVKELMKRITAEKSELEYEPVTGVKETIQKLKERYKQAGKEMPDYIPR